MKLLIVDDEPLARSRLRGLLEDLGGMQVVGEAGNGREALQNLEQHQPDVVLMDIRMPVMDGLEAARHLAVSLGDDAPAVIFTTAYDEHALEAFESSAIDYLVKPVRSDRLEEALRKARRLTGAELVSSDRRTHLCARVRGNLELIPIADIAYLMAEHKYVTVHHQQGEVLIEESLKSLEEEFGDLFVRIHRNALVAKDRLSGLSKDDSGQVRVSLRDVERQLEVSRRNLPAIRKLLRKL